MAKTCALAVIPTNLEVQLYGKDVARKRALLSCISPGDKVTFLRPNGLKLVGGRAMPEFKEATGRAIICQASPGVVVVNLGGRFGTPGCVTAENIVSVRTVNVA